MHKFLGKVTLSMLAVLWMANASAAIVSYEIPYTPVGGQGTTFLDVEIFVDTNDIPGSGTHDVLLDSYRVTFSGTPYPSSPSYLYGNNDNSTSSNNPVTGRFNNGSFTGLLLGSQPGPSPDPFFVRRLGFGFDTFGNVAEIIFFGAHPTKLNLGKDRALQGDISGPFAVVPIPSALFLLAFPLVALNGFLRR